MPNRFKSETPRQTAPIFEKNREAGELIDFILSHLPQHKRVLFLKTKYDQHEVLTAADINDLKKFVETIRKRTGGSEK